MTGPWFNLGIGILGKYFDLSLSPRFRLEVIMYFIAVLSVDRSLFNRRTKIWSLDARLAKTRENEWVYEHRTVPTARGRERKLSFDAALLLQLLYMRFPCGSIHQASFEATQAESQPTNTAKSSSFSAVSCWKCSACTLGTLLPSYYCLQLAQHRTHGWSLRWSCASPSLGLIYTELAIESCCRPFGWVSKRLVCF